MKKWVISLLSIIVIFFVAIIVIPIAFKDDIKMAIDTAIAELVDADVVFDANDFNISLLRNFPNATAQINDIEVINRQPFEGITLFSAKRFDIEIDLFSLFSDKIDINGVKLDSPDINIVVRKDGTANYNIVMSAEESGSNNPSEKPTNFNVGVKNWQISSANMTYANASKTVSLEISDLNYSGSGDFNQNQFDIDTNTTIGAVTITQDGVEYMTNKVVSANAVLTISDNYKRYVFKENKLAINDFGFIFDGYLALNEDGSMDIDMSYAAEQNTLKGLLSLVPGIYTNNFKDIDTAGNLAFNGQVRGKYDSLTMPAFNLALKVDEAMFQFPDLPTEISNLSLELLIDNQDGVIDNTQINMNQFHLEFGKSQIDAKVLVANLKNYELETSIKANINLSELTSVLPMQGISPKGLFNIDLEAKGIYDPQQGMTPKIDAVMNLVNGQVEGSALPFLMDKLNFKAQVSNPSGKMADFVAVIPNFSMEVDGDIFSADLEIADLNQYAWKLNAAGEIDLGKLTQILPLENTSLSGKVKANLSSSGNIEDLKAKNYHLLATSGDISITDFGYSAQSIPYPLNITTMGATFEPKTIVIDHLNGTIGRTDFAVVGSISNYMDYVFAQNPTLKGSMQLSSKFIDLNEFMTVPEEEAVIKPEQQSFGVIEIPKDIDFVITSKVETATLMDMVISRVKGDTIVKGGIAQINGLQFNLLGGKFSVDGYYDPRDIDKPQYDLKLDIQQLSANKAFETISVVKSYFPITQNIDGQISYKVNVKGLLNQAMLPDLEALSAVGELNINQAKLNNSAVIKGIGTLLGNKLLTNEQVAFNDLLMTFTIDDGLVKLKPFELDVGGYKSTLSGSSSLTGALDFDINMLIPVGKLGSKITSLISQYNDSSAISDTSLIPINLSVGGTHKQPTFKINGVPKVSDIIKSVVKEKISDKLELDLDAEKAKHLQKMLTEAQSQAIQIIAETKKIADKVRAQGYAQADKLYNETSDKSLKTMIVAELAKKIKKEADDSANKIEKQGKAQADALLAKAKKEAEALE